MARLGKQIPSSLHGPLARRLHTKSPRNGLSDMFDNLHKTTRKPVVKLNHGIWEKILLVLIVACFLLFVILQLR